MLKLKGEAAVREMHARLSDTATAARKEAMKHSTNSKLLSRIEVGVPMAAHAVLRLKSLSAADTNFQGLNREKSSLQREHDLANNATADRYGSELAELERKNRRVSKQLAEEQDKVDPRFAAQSSS